MFLEVIERAFNAVSTPREICRLMEQSCGKFRLKYELLRTVLNAMTIECRDSILKEVNDARLYAGFTQPAHAGSSMQLESCMITH